MWRQCVSLGQVETTRGGDRCWTLLKLRSALWMCDVQKGTSEEQNKERPRRLWQVEWSGQGWAAVAGQERCSCRSGRWGCTAFGWLVCGWPLLQLSTRRALPPTSQSRNSYGAPVCSDVHVRYVMQYIAVSDCLLVVCSHIDRNQLMLCCWSK